MQPRLTFELNDRRLGIGLPADVSTALLAEVALTLQRLLGFLLAKQDTRLVSENGTFICREVDKAPFTKNARRAQVELRNCACPWCVQKDAVFVDAPKVVSATCVRFRDQLSFDIKQQTLRKTAKSGRLVNLYNGCRDAHVDYFALRHFEHFFPAKHVFVSDALQEPLRLVLASFDDVSSALDRLSLDAQPFGAQLAAACPADVAVADLFFFFQNKRAVVCHNDTGRLQHATHDATIFQFPFQPQATLDRHFFSVADLFDACCRVKNNKFAHFAEPLRALRVRLEGDSAHVHLTF